MTRPWQRALIASLMLMLSSLAGCIGTDELDDDTVSADSLGKVIVSTYHVEQLVSAIAGDLVDVEMMSTENIPAHDYNPSAQDIVRLQGADLFLYHGLGLEPWVNATLEGLGDSAPTAAMTHTLPDGLQALDYESMLIDELCTSLAGLSGMQTTELAEDDHDAAVFEGDDAAYALAFPEHHDDDHDDDHDDHADHDDDHDDHADHDDHGHDLVEAEETMTMVSGCPAGTVVSIYHFEEGHYVLEFEAEDLESFNMAIAMMAGGHAHHDHGDEDHDDHGDEDHDDHGVCHDMSDHSNNNITTQEACEAGGFVWMDEHDEDHDDLSAEEAMEMFDANNDSHLSLSEVFEAMESMEEDDHDHGNETHENHGNETHEDHGNETHEDHGNETHEGNETHDHHDEVEHALEMAITEYMFNMADADNNALLNLSELGMFVELMEDEDDVGEDVMASVFLSVFDEGDNDVLSLGEFTEMIEFMMIEEEHDNEHDHGNESMATTHNETDDDHHDEMNLTETAEMMFSLHDVNNDSSLNLTELSDLMHEMFDDGHEEELAFLKLDIEVEGEYGIALPAGVTMHVISEGDHDDHGHGEDSHDENGHDEAGHDDDDDHGEEGDDHDEEGHDEALAYDPHSWLDPVAFKAQVSLVADLLTTSFPEGADTFAANAGVYIEALEAIDREFTSAFGENGTCEANEVVSNHNAYAYLSARYDIQFVTVHGLDPEAEPSAEDILTVVESIEEGNISVLFIEEYTQASAVQSIVDQTDVQVLTLYTMEMAPSDSDDTYATLMIKNLNNLKTGLGCQ